MLGIHLAGQLVPEHLSDQPRDPGPGLLVNPLGVQADDIPTLLSGQGQFLEQVRQRVGPHDLEFRSGPVLQHKSAIAAAPPAEQGVGHRNFLIVIGVLLVDQMGQDLGHVKHARPGVRFHPRFGGRGSEDRAHEPDQLAAYYTLPENSVRSCFVGVFGRAR